MRIFAFILLLIISIRQCPADCPVWYNGSLVLKSNEVLKGKISVEAAHDMILFRQDGRLMVYTADKIQSVFFYDADENINRKFISFTQKINSFSASYLYEVVAFGEIKILRKLLFPSADPKDNKNSYHYFVLAQNELITFNKFRTKVFPNLLKVSESLSEFIRESRFNPNLTGDIIKIVEHYNNEVRSGSFMPSR